MYHMLKLYLFLAMKKFNNAVNGYQCKNHCCGRIYKTKPGIYNHLKYECGVPPKFFCTICNRHFKQPVSYKAHMLNIHKQLLK